mgnify:CR=1 FL=1
MVKKNTCVFISGKGSNLKNLINKSRDYNFPINVRLVICNNKEAKGIIYAKKNLIPYIVVNSKNRNYENKILLMLKKYKINFICLAGYMKVISRRFLKLYGDKIINIHPSLLPKFKGLNTFSRILENKEQKTGCTVHHVNEKLDSGNIILKKYFYIEKNDDEKTLKLKTQALEYIVYRGANIKMLRYF